jgi:hypothetical protein
MTVSTSVIKVVFIHSDIVHVLANDVVIFIEAKTQNMVTLKIHIN